MRLNIDYATVIELDENGRIARGREYPTMGAALEAAAASVAQS
jgi:hypothetical protein